MAPWILTTPASRGISLQLARRLLRTTNLPVVATARSDLSSVRDAILRSEQYDTSTSSTTNPRLLSSSSAAAVSDEVDPSRLHVLPLDVTDESSIRDAAAECEKLFGKPGPKNANYLHLALVVPGILHPEKAPSQIDMEHALRTFQVNVLGPIGVMKHFAPFLPRKATPTPQQEDLRGLPAHATWAVMSARVGSIAENGLGGWYSYRASKAGVNQVVKTLDNYLRTTAGDRALAVGLHPGTVKTGLSEEFWGGVKEGKLFAPEFAADRLVEVVRDLDVQDRGRCVDWKGEIIPP